MTEDDYLTLTLSQRIKWLHGPSGPRGKMSHDQLGKILNTTRQAIISWEKNGVEPRAPMRKKLAKFSGFQAACFSRREAEELAQDTFGRRLERAEETLERVLQGMVEAGIPIPRAAAEHQSSATVRPKRKTA